MFSQGLCVYLSCVKGTVIKSTGSWYTVELEDGSMVECRIRGKFRLLDIKTTNPVAVGDSVGVEKEADGKGNIVSIEDRRNYIIRRSTNLSRQYHILAANIDQLFLVITIASPRTSNGFIDRFLVTAGSYSIPTVLLFNKKDIYSEKDLAKANEWISIYQEAGYECRLISALDEEDIDQLREKLKGSTTLFCGHSGSGKSTLINAIEPGLNLRTGEVSVAHSKGMHTTTFAEMVALKAGGKIIDTPGIKELGIVEIPKETLSHYFPEMKKFLNQCRFDNCIHLNEPTCRIKQAVEEGEISEMRYYSYLNILTSEA